MLTTKLFPWSLARPAHFAVRFCLLITCVLIGLALLPTARPSQIASAQIPSPINNDEKQEMWLTVRLLPNAKAATLELLAKISVPEKRLVKKGDDIVAILKQKYGFFNSTIWSIFKKYNPGINTYQLESDTEIVLPAGPRWYFTIPKNLPLGSSVEEQAALQMGTAGDKTRQQVTKTNKGENIDWDKIITESEPQAEVTFPYVTRPVSVKVQAEFLPLLNSFISALNKDKAVIQLEVAPVVKFASKSRTSSRSPSENECEDKLPEAGWYTKSLGLDSIPKDSLREHSKIITAIVDSGLFQGTRFSSILWHNDKEISGEKDEDDDKNLCIDDFYGCDLLQLRGFPIDDLEIKERYHHGTHVAGIASGCLVKGDLGDELAKRIQLIILKVIDQSGVVNPSAVADAIIYAQEKNAKVMNMSLDYYKSPSIRAQLKLLEERILVVAAAGNGEDSAQGKRGVDITRSDYHPAKLTAELNNVISVAAHNQLDMLACFSNFGLTTVDIAAPGSAIESSVTDNDNDMKSGTSQATPFVSLAAALIWSQNPSLRPIDVKNRLLSSSDYLPSLENKVSSSGKLNLAKAISIYDDVIQLKDEPLLRGKIICPKHVDIAGEDQRTLLSSIKKITFSPVTPTGKSHRVVLESSNGKLQYLFKDLNIPFIVVKVKDEIRKIMADKIIDITPALYRPSSNEDCSSYVE